MRRRGVTQLDACTQRGRAENREEDEVNRNNLDRLVLEAKSVEGGDGLEGVVFATIVNKTITKTLACNQKHSERRH